MKRKAGILLVIALLLMLGVTAYAASSYPMIYRPGTTDTVTNMPQNDSGTGGDAYTVSSTVPQREGYEFLGWKLDHGQFIYVTYVVNPDPVYGIPKDSTVPTDPTQYIPGMKVAVEAQLTTTDDSGTKLVKDSKGEPVKDPKTGEDVYETRPGVWTFVPWNVEGFGETKSFEIKQDTTITGEWKFTPYFKYTVHHLDVDDFRQLADDEVCYLDELGPGQVEHKAKVPRSELYTQYRKSGYSPVSEDTYNDKRPDFLLPGATYVKNKTKFIMTVTLTEDDQHIFFFYQHGGSM